MSLIRLSAAVAVMMMMMIIMMIAILSSQGVSSAIIEGPQNTLLVRCQDDHFNMTCKSDTDNEITWTYDDRTVVNSSCSVVAGAADVFTAVPVSSRECGILGSLSRARDDPTFRTVSGAYRCTERSNDNTVNASTVIVLDTWCGVLNKCLVTEGDDVVVGCYAQYDWLSLYLQFAMHSVNASIRFLEYPDSLYAPPPPSGTTSFPPPSEQLMTTHTIRNVKGGDKIETTCKIDFLFNKNPAIGGRFGYAINTLEYSCHIRQNVYHCPKNVTIKPSEANTAGQNLTCSADSFTQVLSYAWSDHMNNDRLSYGQTFTLSAGEYNVTCVAYIPVPCMQQNDVCRENDSLASKNTDPNFPFNLFNYSAINYTVHWCMPYTSVYGYAKGNYSSDSTKHSTNRTTTTPTVSACLLDLSFVIDHSGSIRNTNLPGIDNWQLILDFIASFASRINIGQQQTHVGAVSFGNYATLNFYLTNFTDKTALVDAVRNIPYGGGNTNTTGALRLMRTEIFNAIKGDRADVPNVAILISDGVPNREIDQLGAEVSHVKNSGIRIIGVGVTTAVNETIMRSIVSNPFTDYLFVSGFIALENQVSDLVFRTCGTTSTPVSSTTRLTGNTCLLDVSFVIDHSTSIVTTGFDNWLLILDFISGVVSEINVGQHQTHVGAVSFGNDATLNFYLTNFTNRTALFDAVRNIPYIGGDTNTTGALRLMRTEIFNATNGDRADVPNVAILITDGDPTREVDQLNDEVSRIKNSGVRIIGVGVTSAVSAAIMGIIVTNPFTDYKFINTFVSLDNYVNEIVRLACDTLPRTTAKITMAFPGTTAPATTESTTQTSSAPIDDVTLIIIIVVVVIGVLLLIFVIAIVLIYKFLKNKRLSQSDQQRGETELNVMSNKHKDFSYDTHSIYDEIQDEDNKYEELTTDLYEPLEDREQNDAANKNTYEQPYPVYLKLIDDTEDSSKCNLENPSSC